MTKETERELIRTPLREVPVRIEATFFRVDNPHHQQILSEAATS